MIELLVVVAIIVILIAILVPSLNKALYVSTLANCSANMDGFATAVTVYAHANKDKYPNRTVYDQENVQTEGVVTVNGADPLAQAVMNYGGLMGMLKWAPQQDNSTIRPRNEANTTGDPYDDRPMWATLLDVNNSFIDPFTNPINMTHPDSHDTDDLVLSSMDILVGWGWNGEGKMLSLGSRITYTIPSPHAQQGQNFSWDLLMMDRDINVSDYAVFGYPAAGYVFTNPDLDYWAPSFTSHPETSGEAMHEMAVENTLDTEKGYSLWVSQFVSEGPRDNKMDRNFAHADGSVETMKDIFAGGGLAPLQLSPAKEAKFGMGGGHVADDNRMVVVPPSRAGRRQDYNEGTMLMPRR